MGGRGRSRTQRKHFRQSRENVWKRPKSDESQNPQNSSNNTPDDSSNDGKVNRNPGWQPFATQNTGFDEYYKEQEVVSPEEWDTFIEYLRKPLPAAFRINSSSQFHADIRRQLENDFSVTLQAEDNDGIEVEAIKPLPWYPNNLAWHSNFSRNQLRKNQTLERFHEFLKLENETGNITRQEAVSMVPPLFLDVQPHHFVLDMCAAPGSKTFQLLEMIHQLTEPGTLPGGMVIANDLDVQRCNLLIHQTKRMCTSNLIVTNHEAQHFPSCHLHWNHINNSEIENGITQLQFDRVLCDVPCSGDGTLRKAPDIWRKWNAGNGNGLHGLQVQIAMRGMSLLKVGGRMIYSTCSMNPIENEAVVAEILRRCGGSVELVDVSSELPQLICRPGLKKWKVRDKGVWFASYKDIPKNRRSVVTSGMFPSGETYDESSEHDHKTATTELVDNGKAENTGNGLQSTDDPMVPAESLEPEVSTLPLERCMRIVPHDQNTGAFFIAVFNKLSPTPVTQKKTVSLPGKLDSSNAQAEISKEVKDDSNGVEIDSTVGTEDQLSEVTVDADMNETNEVFEENEKEDTQPSPLTKTGPAGGKRKLQIQGKWRGVDPVLFYRDDSVIDRIMEFYGIKDSFPFKGHLITRNIDNNHVKRIYYISKSVKEVLELNLLSGEHLKIASVGLKMFERQTAKEGTSAPCLFRISSEGLPLILPHITKQILYASPVDFKHLLQFKVIKFADFVNPEFGEKASKLMLGCCVVVLRADDKDVSVDQQVDALTVAIGCWRGRTNVAVMVTAIDCQELLERLSSLNTTETLLLENISKQLEADEIRNKNDLVIKQNIETSTPANLG